MPKILVTIPDDTWDWLVNKASKENRTLANLAATILIDSKRKEEEPS